MKVLRKAFLCLHFRFELSVEQESWCKNSCKMLVKLTTGVNPTKLRKKIIFPFFAIKLGLLIVSALFCDVAK
jgi:hypothetical protein